VGVYGESMSYFQILKNHGVKELLKVKEHLLRAMVKPPRSSSGSDCNARIEGIAWRKLGEERN